MEVPRRAVVARFPLPWSHYVILFTVDEAMREPLVLEFRNHCEEHSETDRADAIVCYTLGTLPKKIMARECRLGITSVKKLEADVAPTRKRLERVGRTSVGPRK